MPGGIGRRLIFIFLAFATIGLVLSEVAWAQPPAITKAKSDAEALQERIDELSDQLDAAVEDYNYAKAQLAETKAAQKKTQLDLTQTEADLGVANAGLDSRLVEIYKAGGLGALDIVVGASSFSELISALDLMQRLSEQDSRLVDEVSDYQDRVATRKAELAKQLADEKVLAADADAAKKKVEERLAANREELKGKEVLIAQLEREEAARQARLAAEAKKRAEEARQKAALEAAAKAKAKSQVSKPVVAKKVSVPESADSNDVVSIAMNYLGVPYVWAGSSPSGFDCSGFVMYVYNKMGIDLPHSSRLQYGCGQPVSRSELQPGDLVFFYDPIHHVGIYIGDGKMIHAAGSGKDVRISDVWSRNYYGACRIIG